MKHTGIGKKTLSLILTFCLVLGLLPGLSLTAKAETTGNWIDSAASEYAGGTGAVDDPYQIATVEQLAYLAKQVNAGTDYSGIYFIQTAAIDLAGKEWTPIGYFPDLISSTANAFKGNYDGGNKTISNLCINNTSTRSTTNYTGLFGYIGFDKADKININCIMNVNLSSVTVSANNSGSNQIGALVGFAGVCKILNCSVSGGSVSCNGPASGCGGLIGAFSSNDRTYAANCWANVSVTNTGSTQYGSTGGFVGCFGDGAATIANCYARGDVSSSSGGGGFSGWSYGQLINCYSTGKVNNSYTPCAHNTSNSSFKVLSLSTYYLSDSNDSAVSGWSGSGKTADTMKSQDFLQTLNINRSCASGLLPSDIVLYKWKIAADENDGYPVFDPTAANASDGTVSDSAATFSGGDGSQSNAYQISCKADMIQYEVNINSYTKNDTSGTYYSAAYYIVTEDIDMGGGTFTPIGLTDQTAFSGSIDFQNHIIVNYTPDTSTGVPTDYGNLLGITSSPIISNYTAAIIGTADAGVTLSDATQTVSVKTADGTYDDSTGYGLIQVGEYLLREAYDWSGTVTPSKSGCTITPASRTYNDIESNQMNQNYTATADKPTLTATADNARNCVDLSWMPVSGDDHYMVYQKDSGKTIYQSIPVSTDIKVLNVYPDMSGQPITNGGHTSDALKSWMDTNNMGSPKIGDTQYYMSVNNVALSSFNANPEGCLSKDSNGNYNYDVVYFGSWDCNGDGENKLVNDLSSSAKGVMDSFIGGGGGCLFGHDTVNPDTVETAHQHPNFVALANKYLNMLCNNSYYLYGNVVSQTGNFTSTLQVVKKGLLTNYPYLLSQTLEIPASHTTYQFAKGDVWMEFTSSNGYEHAVQIDTPDGTNNFYLTTWNNTAMIQTGHSCGQATMDERMLLTNTLYYLAQVTKHTSAADHMAQDLAAPNAVDSSTVAVHTSGDTTLSWSAPSDNGSSYEYRVREFTSADGSSHVDSDTANATVTMGIKDYYVLIDNNSTATAVDVKVANNMVTTPSYTASSSLTAGSYYAHILTEDNAGNESPVTTQSFNVTAYTATVNVKIDGAAAAAPGTGTVVLKESGSSDVTLSSTSTGVYTASVVNGTYNVFANNENTGKTIKIDGVASEATVDYYTVSFTASNAGAADGSSVTAEYNGSSITTGAIVLGGKELKLTATGAIYDSGNATNVIYSYAWSGTGTSNETATTLTIVSLGGQVDATCAVTGSTSYAVTLNTNSGKINSGVVSSYTYGTGVTLPTDITNAGFVFGGWYVAPDFSGSVVSAISNTDKGAKIFYAKWMSMPPVAGSGKALKFDGMDDYVEVPSNSAYTTNQFTVEAWIQYDTNQDWSGVVDKGRNISKNWWILTSDASNRGVTVGMQGAGDLIYTWNDSDWHHVCINYDGTTFSLYVDGVLRESVAVSLSYYEANLTGAAINFGRRQSSDVGGFRFFNGQLDEVKLWSTARTQAQIKQDMYSHNTTDPALVGCWSFDEGSGMGVTDSSATKANGTLTNAVDSAWVNSDAWQSRVTAQNVALDIDAGYAWDGGNVTLAAETGPSHGTLSFSDANKNVTYTPDVNYSGADSFTYTVTKNSVTKSYSVIMTVVQNPVMTGPESKTSLAGTSASFTVTVSAPSTGLSYQWQKYDGASWNDITGATDANYNISSVTAGDAGRYRCVVKNTVGTTTATATSGEATLTVTNPVTVTNDGNGAGSASPSSAQLGNEVTLTATPANGYHFKEWKVISGTVTIASDKFTMPAEAVTVQAVFEKTDYPITVTNDGNGAGSASPSSAQLGNEVTLTATPNNGYHFKEWKVISGTVTIASDKFAMPAEAVTVQAVFEKTDYPITVTNDGNGAGSASPSSAQLGDEVTLTATPANGYHFKEWKVISGTVTIASDKFTMPAEAVTVQAVFEKTDYPITVTNDGNGAGSASPSSAQLGDEVTLTATPTNGYHFKEWKVISGTVTIASDKFTMPAETVTVQAVFEKTDYPITVTNDGNGTGSASPSSAQLGNEVTLTATPANGYHFKEWKVISGTVTIASDKFTMPAEAVTVQAVFEKTDYPITVTNDGNGTGSASSASAQLGDEVTLTVTPANGYHFKEWKVISGTVTIASDKFTMPAEAVTVQAVFEKTDYPITVTNDGNGTGSASPSSAQLGDEVTLTATPTNGYHFKEWKVISGTMTIASDKFAMPAEAVTVQAVFEINTFMATVNVKRNDAISSEPVTGAVELKQGGDTKATLTGGSGVYTAIVLEGTYNVFVNNEDTGKTITINNAANSATVDYYTVSFSASDSGASDGSKVTAKYDSNAISSGAIVLGGKALELTAIGAICDSSNATSPSYTYAWTGDGISGTPTTQNFTIDSLTSVVNAACTVTGSATYKVKLNVNSGTINSGDVSSYAYGTGATLPTDVTKDGYVFGGWYADSDLSGITITVIGNTDKGAKSFYAKWVQNPVMTGPENKTAAAGTSASFTVTELAPSTGLSYQWQKLNGSKWDNISSATGATYTNGNVAAGDVGKYRCVVTATDGTTTATTTSGEATLTVTFAATVNINIDGSAAAAPGTGTVELKQSGTLEATLTGGSGVYIASVVNGTYNVFVNNEDTGKTITMNNAANSATVDYYTVSFSASDTGAATGSTVTATAGGMDILNGATVLSGKKIVLTATGAGASYYSYFWSGSGANGETSALLTIPALKSKVDARCTVTGRASPTVYSVSLDTNGGAIGSGSITSYTYGVCVALPVNVTRANSVFIGWFATSNFSGSPVTEISATDTGDKTFYAKWNYDIGGVISDDDGTVLHGATVTIRGNNITPKSTTTDLGGNYSFSDITPGEYNIVALYNDITKTIILRVTDQNISDANITMPTAGAENSVVNVAQDTPDVVVGYLDQQFSSIDDTYVSSSGNTVKLELAVEEKSKEKVSDAADIQAQAGNRTIDMYLDMKLTKTKTGTEPSNKPLLFVDSLLKIIIPYDLSGKTDVVVYRVHEGVTEALTKQTYSESAPSDECYMVNTAENQVVVWAKKFSTYAIAYSNVVWDSGSSSYTVTASAGTGGTISPSGSVSVTTGSSKTFTVTARDGYVVSNVLVDDKSVGAVGSYTFTNVTASHTISAAFSKAKGLPYYLDNSGDKVFIGFAEDTSGTMKYIAPEGKTVLFTPNPKSFSDISGHWAKSYIDFGTQREIFIGTGNNIFSPDTGMTRAMFATVIGRLYERSYGTPNISGDHAFTDCDYESWYGSYIDWCSENGIIEGVGGGLFEPNREITRQEMAAIIYRFAEFLKISKVSESATLNYPDSAKIASWAEQAALYCQETGIIEGRDGGNFVPQGTATRAEVAAILERFVEKVV